MGAWIETTNLKTARSLILSHPVWVRGLKQQASDVNDFAKWVAPRVGAWIETPSAQMERYELAGRTPCGCVD